MMSHVISLRFFCFMIPSEKSAVSHSITWRSAVSVKPVEISGATSFAVSGQLLSFASLGSY